MRFIRSHSTVFRALALVLAGWSCHDSSGPAAGGVRERWYQPQPGVGSARPAVSGNVVYFGTSDGQIIARDVGTGIQRWATTVGADPVGVGGANLLVRNGVVVAPITNYTVGLDELTGLLLWRYEAPNDAAGRPPGAPNNPGQVIRSRIDADNVNVFIPAWGASVSAVNLKTGSLQWVWTPGTMSGDTAVSGVFRSGSSSIRFSGGFVFATMWHDLDRDGRTSEAWVVRLGQLTGIVFGQTLLPDQGSGAFIEGAPAVYGNVSIVNTGYARTYAIEWNPFAQMIWQFRAPAPTLFTPTEVEIYGDVAYLDGGDNRVYALRASDGTVIWSSPIPGGVLRDMLVTERRVIIPTNKQLYILDRQTGAQIAVVTQPNTNDPHFLSPPAFADGLVFVAVSGAAWCFEEP